MKITVTFSDPDRKPIERDGLDDRLGVLVVAGGDWAMEWLNYYTLVETTDNSLELSDVYEAEKN